MTKDKQTQAKEPCEMCGSEVGIRYFGTDFTPLCPSCYAAAERNVNALEQAMMQRRKIVR